MSSSVPRTPGAVMDGSAPVHQRAWEAELGLTVARRPGGSTLTERRHRGPLRVQKALHPEGPDPVHLVILHPPAGIAGGDRLTVDCRIETGAHALVTTPGAAKWYRSGGDPARANTHLALGPDAVLEWLPQESIFFDGAEASTRLSIESTSGARMIGWDIVVLGRRARGERFEQGRLAQEISWRRDGNLVWCDRLALGGGDDLLQTVSGLDGQHVAGVFWAFGTVFPADLDDWARSRPESAARCSVSRREPDFLLARGLASSPEALRRVFIELWALVRPILCARTALLPRLWAT